MTKNNDFSPDWTVAELLQAWPETIPVFLGHRLGCVGCAMASFDTLADVVKIYGLPAGTFFNALERAVQKQGQDLQEEQTEKLD